MRQPSTTKKGPGRYHKPGHKKASPLSQRLAFFLARLQGLLK